MKLRVIRALVTLTATIGLLTGGVDSATAKAPQYLKLKNFNLCAVPYGGSNSDGAYVTQWNCTESTNDVWHWRVNDGAEIVHEGSNSCLTPLGGGITDGTILTIWPCNGNHSQVWDYDSSRGAIKNIVSGLYITTYGGSLKDGTYLTLFHWTGDLTQHWEL